MSSREIRSEGAYNLTLSCKSFNCTVRVQVLYQTVAKRCAWRALAAMFSCTPRREFCRGPTCAKLRSKVLRARFGEARASKIPRAGRSRATKGAGGARAHLVRRGLDTRRRKRCGGGRCQSRRERVFRAWSSKAFEGAHKQAGKNQCCGPSTCAAVRGKCDASKRRMSKYKTTPASTA